MKSETPVERAENFLNISSQFKLGKLTTETPHPRSVKLSQTAKESIPAALEILFDVDRDVLGRYHEWSMSGAPERIAGEVLEALLAGGRVFFTGCGATGRLSIQMDSIWRDFWQRKRAEGLKAADEWENRTFSVMAGGDFALIKSVEGFEDYTQFGKQQIGQMGVREGDVVFAITEGGETSFVIGTAWKGLGVGARVFFVYNNPDSILRETVERSRQVIDEPRIEKINLTTGPMAITGSTRMQATSIQLCVMITLMEMILRELLAIIDPEHYPAGASARVPGEFRRTLDEMHATLMTETIRQQVAGQVALEEGIYRAKHRNTYFADRLAIDILTDTTERSPTFCIPAFRKFDDTDAAESWSFLFLPYEDTPTAWERLLKRPLNPVEWDMATIRQLIPDGDADKQYAVVQAISRKEIHRFRIGMDGLAYRKIGPGDSATCIVTEEEMSQLVEPGGFYRDRLEKAHSDGAKASVIFFGLPEAIEKVRAFLASWSVPCHSILEPVPKTDMMLNGSMRIGAKMLLNALSTCTMVRLGRVMGNVMIWLVPSNLKLIDRSTRYIQNLSGLQYEEACRLLFEAIDYVAPRMLAGKEYPSTVGLAVNRALHHCDFAEAEERLYKDL